MRILMNANSLLLSNYSCCLRSARNFRWSLSAVSVAPHLSTSTIHSNINYAINANRKFAHMHPPYLSRSITTSGRLATKSIGTENFNASSDTEAHPDGVTIYTGKFTRQIIRVKLFSLTTSCMGLLAQPVLWHKGLEVSGTGLSVLLCSVAGVFIFVTPVLLHFVTKKYVIDIKYNEKTDEYTSMTVSFFLFQNKTKFKIEDIHIPEIETMFSSMLIGPKKQPVFVDAASFTDTHHYARFMGYDKPLDFRLDTNQINEQSTNQPMEKEKSTQSENK